MKICLVTAFPPSRRGLNEYGFHIARELRRDPVLSLTILADELEGEAEELSDYDVVRCWRFDSLSNPVRLLNVLNDIKPDVVWFNLLFSTFGNQPVPAFFGLMQPVLSRLSGRYTHVTLHHLMDNINLADSGVRFPRLYQVAGSAATRMLLMANSISVLLAGLSPHTHRQVPGLERALPRPRHFEWPARGSRLQPAWKPSAQYSRVR